MWLGMALTLPCASTSSIRDSSHDDQIHKVQCIKAGPTTSIVIKRQHVQKGGIKFWYCVAHASASGDQFCSLSKAPLVSHPVLAIFHAQHMGTFNSVIIKHNEKGLGLLEDLSVSPLVRLAVVLNWLVP